MAKNISNQNAVQLNTSTTNQIPVMRAAASQQVAALPRKSKRPESFFSALLRVFSSVAF
jgi:hypothetical protein